MTIDIQEEIIKLYKQYKSTDSHTIKANFIDIMNDLKMKPSILSDLTGVAVQTIYQLKKIQSIYVPDFITALILCNAMDISITELFQYNNKDFEEWETKWDITAKAQFIQDYEKVDMLELTKKYNIGARTAQEYHREFKKYIDNSE